MARRQQAVTRRRGSGPATWPDLSGIRRAAVLGDPIAHSLSPLLHRTAYQQLGLNWAYDAVEVDVEHLPDFLDGCGSQWAGLSLTRPLKQAVVGLLGATTPTVDLLGVANTVVFGADGSCVGHNTDVVGITEALREIGAEPGPAVIVGGGATAASALAALDAFGCPSVQVRARRPEVASALLGPVAEQVAIELAVTPWLDSQENLPASHEAAVTVSAVPGEVGVLLAERVPEQPGALLDVSYEPWPNPLVEAWRRNGGAAAAGDRMLVHQAIAQIELMTGRRPDLAVLDAALQTELDQRARAGSID